MSETIETKQCSQCGEVKDVELFPRKGRVCKYCTALYKKQYWENNKDKATKSIHNWREKHKDKIRYDLRMHYEKNKEIILPKAREYREKNKNKIIEKDKIYYENNTLQILKRNKEWAKRNQDKIRLYYSRLVEEINDTYVMSLLKQSGFPKESISPDLIETKRLIIKIKRHVKNKTNSSTQHSGTTLQNGGKVRST